MIALIVLTASAVEVDVTAAVGSMRATDPALERFTSRRGHVTLGLGASVRPTPERRFPLAAIVSLTHSQRGRALTDGEVWLGTRLSVDTLGLGVKADFRVARILAPYLSLQGTGVRGVGRISDGSDDPDRRQRRSGVGVGALGLAGLEISSRTASSTTDILFHIESGASWTPGVTLGDWGAVRPAGWIVRTGAGVRFR